jgi:hypothetical protein
VQSIGGAAALLIELRKARLGFALRAFHLRDLRAERIPLLLDPRELRGLREDERHVLGLQAVLARFDLREKLEECDSRASWTPCACSAVFISASVARTVVAACCAAASAAGNAARRPDASASRCAMDACALSISAFQRSRSAFASSMRR